MNTFYRLALLSITVSITAAHLHAGIQNGKRLPDEILILNDTNKVATINGVRYNPQQEAKVLTKNQTGTVEIQVNGQSYVLVYPLYQRGIFTQEMWNLSRANISDIIAGRAVIE